MVTNGSKWFNPILLSVDELIIFMNAEFSPNGLDLFHLCQAMLQGFICKYCRDNVLIYFSWGQTEKHQACERDLMIKLHDFTFFKKSSVKRSCILKNKLQCYPWNTCSHWAPMAVETFMENLFLCLISYNIYRKNCTAFFVISNCYWTEQLLALKMCCTFGNQEFLCKEVKVGCMELLNLHAPAFT